LRLFYLQGGYIFLKEVFEFSFGKHAINDTEDGLFVFIIELVNEL